MTEFAAAEELPGPQCSFVKYLMHRTYLTNTLHSEKYKGEEIILYPQYLHLSHNYIRKNMHAQPNSVTLAQSHLRHSSSTEEPAYA